MDKTDTGRLSLVASAAKLAADGTHEGVIRLSPDSAVARVLPAVPTFDQWHVQQYGMTFGDLHLQEGQPIAVAWKKLMDATQEYLTAAVALVASGAHK